MGHTRCSREIFKTTKHSDSMMSTWTAEKRLKIGWKIQKTTSGTFLLTGSFSLEWSSQPIKCDDSDSSTPSEYTRSRSALKIQQVTNVRSKRSQLMAFTFSPRAPRFGRSL